MIKLIGEYSSIIKIGISNTILQILNSYESQKTKLQTYYGVICFMEFIFMAIFVKSIPNICFGNAIWALFIFFISISNYHYFLGFIRKILYFGLNGIQNNRFFLFSKKLSYLSIFSLLFSKKELKTTKNVNKVTRQKTFTYKIITISSIIYLLLFLINIAYFEKLYKRKQPLSLLTEVAKFLKNPKNIPIVPFLWLNDNEIICNVGLGCESENIDQGRSYFNVTIDISHCFFSRSLSYSGNGGVIYVNGDSYSMNINYSMFYNCVCSQYGGAIYFDSSNSSLRMICANSCSASYYHFAGLSTSQVNQVEHLSVSNCSHTTSGDYPIRSLYGDQRVDNTNSSMNKADSGSSILISSPSSFTSSHCTFSNNKVSKCICIYFYSSSGTISMSYANIIQNSSPSLGVVYVDGEGTRKMMYCIFQKNSNFLFYVNSGSLEVSHSFFNHTSSSFSSSYPVLVSLNNSYMKTQTYKIEFLGSQLCKSPSQLPENSKFPFLSWVEYSVVSLIILTLLVFLFLYRRIATNLQERNLLEGSLINDFG